MSSTIKKKPGLVKNNLPQQSKQAANSLSIQDWNTFMNVLSRQTNNNTTVLDAVHQALYGTYDANTSDTINVPTIPELEALLDTYGISLDLCLQEIANIKSGVTVVKKAEQDELGNNIVAQYETKADARSKSADKADLVGNNLFRGTQTIQGDIRAVNGEFGSADVTGELRKHNTKIVDVAPGTASQDAVNKSQLDLKEATANKGAPNGYAPLNALSLIPDEYISNKVTVEVVYVENFEDILLLSDMHIGDVVKVTSEGVSYTLAQAPASTAENWCIYIDKDTYKDVYTFQSLEDFPIRGTTDKIYLAKQQNTALEGEEPVWEDYNMLFRWDSDIVNYIPIAGQGSGGGGSSVTARVIPYPYNTPVIFSHAYGAELTVGYFYSNPTYTSAQRMIYVNDILRGTSTIATGEGYFEVSKYLNRGLNTIKIYIVDAEANPAQLIYRVTADSVVLTSAFDEAHVYSQEEVLIPYAVSSPASIRKVYYKLDDAEVVEGTMLNPNAILTFATGTLAHGVHYIELYVVGEFYKDGTLSYSIESPHLHFSIFYNAGTSTAPMIACKFDELSQRQGEAFSIEYIVHTPGLEFSSVELYVDDTLTQSLSVLTQKTVWNINNLALGTHYLKIKSGVTERLFTIEVAESLVSLEVIKDNYLQLYLDAFGKSNSALDKNVWANLYGNEVAVTLNNLNFVSNGWIGDALKLNAESSATVNFKPFEGAVSASGKTIEIDFKTRMTTDENLVLMQCLSGNIGFTVKPNTVEIKGSNITTSASFKEDEHLTVSFVISPIDNIVYTYINGVISGLNFISGTSFRQMIPDNIHINENGGSIDVYSIRYYNRALRAKEVLNNYLASIDDVALRLEKYYFNDIYDDYGNPSLEKMAGRIPIMKIEGCELPNAKVDPRPKINVYFDHPYEPSKNFERTGMNCEINVQGTSSLAYPIKNFKIYLPKAAPYIMEPGMFPERKFTLKADYMDSSHSHNSGLAKLFDTMYVENTPPKDFNSVVRTTIYGYPMALFHRVNPTDPWVYKGVYNFNLDKDCEDSLGLNNEYEWEEGNPDSVFPETKSYEIAFNADGSSGAFKSANLGDVVISFETRFPELDEFVFFNDNAMGVSPLSMLNELKDALKSYTVDSSLQASIDAADYDEIISIYDTNFSDRPDPYHSLGNLPMVETFRNLQTHYAPLRGAIQWVIDNDASITFRTEFEQHFNLEHNLKYLVATLVFGLVDNLGKNAMFNTWDGQVFYPAFYDVDTAMGVDNLGKLVHDYDIEIGEVGSYATSDSLLWKNILQYFIGELRLVYTELRLGIFAYENIMNYLYEQQISKISESQYNEDSFAKYIGVTTSWLYMAQGTTLEHKKRWLTLRLAFLDSKFLYQDFTDSMINIRTNLPEGVTEAGIELTSTITQYLGVQYGAALNNIIQVKAQANTPITVLAPLSEINPEGGAIEKLETWVYGAKWIKEMGSISHLYPSTVDIENATRLERLTVGSSAPGYDNHKLTTVAVGSNTYLKYIDLRNCSGLGTDPSGTQDLDLSGAVNLEEVYAGGTSLHSVQFAAGASVAHVELPATITKLDLVNMNNITNETLVIAGVNNLAYVRIENTPNFDAISFVNTIPHLQALRLVGLSYSCYGMGPIIALKNLIWDSDLNAYKLYCIESDGSLTAEKPPIITGVFKVLTTEEVSAATLNELNRIFPNLDIQINQVPAGLTFVDNPDGTMSISGYTESVGLNLLSLPTEYNNNISVETPITLNTDGWKQVTAIKDHVFYGKSIREVVIPSTIKTIESYAFANMNDLYYITIPMTVETMQSTVFDNNVHATILTEYAEKPVGWANDWNGNVIAVFWDVPFTNRTFTFGNTGDSTINPIIDNVLLTAPDEPNQYGYDFAGWTYNGAPVIFPFIPAQTDPGTITFVATWTVWVYTINYMIPTSSSNSTLVLHTTQQVNYGDTLGEFFTAHTTGADVPVVADLAFVGRWTENNTAVNASYSPIIDQRVSGAIITLVGTFYTSQGLTYKYNAAVGCYNVTAYSASSTVPDGSVYLLIPATYKGALVQNITLTASATSRLKIGVIEIQSNELTARSYNAPGTSSSPVPLSSLREIVLPANLTEIANDAFKDCTALTSITLPSNLLTIGEGAFKGCTALTSPIVIPSGVTWIKSNTFEDCGLIPSVTFHNDITMIDPNAFRNCINARFNELPSELVSILSSAFENCFMLTSITIPSGVTALYAAFKGCTALTYVSLPEGLTSLNGTFDGCTALASITLPSTLTTIGQYAFRNSGLTSITIPDNVTTVSTNAFYKCSNLVSITIQRTNITTAYFGTGAYATGADTTFYFTAAQNAFKLVANGKAVVNIAGTILYAYPGAPANVAIGADLPSTVATIESYAFFNCATLSSIILKSTMTKIGDYAFQDCVALTSITMPVSCSNVKIGAFKGCTALLALILPTNVTTINNYLCQGCASLTSVTLPAGLTTINTNAFDGCTSLTSITIPANVTQINTYAFQNTGLTSVTIPSKVSIISSYAFAGCIALASVTLAEGVTRISGTYAFADCPALTSVTLPSTFTTFSNYVFQNCSMLTSITIPAGVTIITAYAFAGCTALASVTLPEGLTTIYAHAFDSCVSLASVTLPSTLETISNFAFQNSGLTSITIPAGVTIIDMYTFAGCASLASVTFHAAMTSINAYSFQDCVSLEEVVIPPSVTTLPRAFQGCTALASVTLPEGLTSLDGTFMGCTSLASITLPSTLVTIGYDAFRNTGLTSITIPASVSTIGYYAFTDCTLLSTIICQRMTPPSLSYDTIFDNIAEPHIIYVPVGTLSAYQNATNWNEYAFSMQEVS